MSKNWEEETEKIYIVWVDTGLIAMVTSHVPQHLHSSSSSSSSLSSSSLSHQSRDGWFLPGCQATRHLGENLPLISILCFLLLSFSHSFITPTFLLLNDHSRSFLISLHPSVLSLLKISKIDFIIFIKRLCIFFLQDYQECLSRRKCILCSSPPPKYQIGRCFLWTSWTEDCCHRYTTPRLKVRQWRLQLAHFASRDLLATTFAAAAGILNTLLQEQNSKEKSEYRWKNAEEK